MIGTTLSHFRVTAKLGEGGMGEVYRAEDTKLGREVAIKVLPEAVAADPERLARFEREAKVLASLNHPNIAAIYSIESDVAQSQPEGPLAPRDEVEAALGDPPTGSRAESGSIEETEAAVGGGTAPQVHFLVMELVEGQDLKERLDRGPIPVDEALPIALQIARALETAHEQGIVHRDLKPANVKVTADGRVKVLDFGLAKALESGTGTPQDASQSALSMSPTLTAQMTQAGVILGTAAYMSPEQAAGEPADRRADIWAFGVVLAEMLTGRPQFDGKSVSHVLAAILKDDPDWEALAARAPAPVLDLVQHCLRKEPNHRLQAIGDARILIQDYLDDPDSFSPPSTAGVQGTGWSWRQSLPWALLASMLLTVTTTRWFAPEQVATEMPVIRATVLPPPDAAFYLSGWNPGPVTVSPDGTKLAFSVQDEEGTVRLYVRELRSGEAQPLPGTESAAYPFWAPDSRWLGFFTDVDQTLKKIDTAGGPPVTLCTAENGKGGSWNQDGVIVFAPRADTAIHRISADGGEPEAITDFDRSVSNSHRHPRFLPDGQHFLYLARGGVDQESNLRVRSLVDGADRVIGQSSTQGEFAAGQLLFTRGTTLMAQEFDAESLQLRGEATPVVDEILTNTGAAMGVFSASSSGILAYNSGVLNPRVALEWRDRAGNRLETVGEPDIYGPIALSPDGEKLASVIYDDAGIGSIWLTEVSTGLRNRLTFDANSDYGLAWSPDSSSLIFSNRRDAAYVLVRVPIGGVGEMETLLENQSDILLSDVSPDGKTLLFWQTRVGTSRDLLIWDVGERGEPTYLRETEADERFSSFSPDGNWIAYTSNESGRYEIYVTPFPGPGRRWQVSQNSGMFPQWGADGREIVYSQQNGMLMAVPVTTGADTLTVGAAEPLFQIHPPRPDGTSFALAPDGQRILVWSTRQQQAETVVNLVVNWPAELEDR